MFFVVVYCYWAPSEKLLVAYLGFPISRALYMIIVLYEIVLNDTLMTCEKINVNVIVEPCSLPSLPANVTLGTAAWT